jgi:hypothetical protein
MLEQMIIEMNWDKKSAFCWSLLHKYFGMVNLVNVPVGNNVTVYIGKIFIGQEISLRGVCRRLFINV